MIQANTNLFRHVAKVDESNAGDNRCQRQNSLHLDTIPENKEISRNESVPNLKVASFSHQISFLFNIQ